MEVDSNVRLVWLVRTKFGDKIIMSALETIKKEVDKFRNRIYNINPGDQGTRAMEWRKRI